MRTATAAAILLMLCAGAKAQTQTECGKSNGFAYYFSGGAVPAAGATPTSESLPARWVEAGPEPPHSTGDSSHGPVPREEVVSDPSSRAQGSRSGHDVRPHTY